MRQLDSQTLLGPELSYKFQFIFKIGSTKTPEKRQYRKPSVENAPARKKWLDLLGYESKVPGCR